VIQMKLSRSQLTPIQKVRGSVNPEARRLAGLRLKAARMALGYDKPRGKTQEAFYAQIGERKQAANHWEVRGGHPAASGSGSAVRTLQDRSQLDPARRSERATGSSRWRDY
jgi:hypothetical protein